MIVTKMSKMQKIWLGIFASMFLVPEILWSPVMNYAYSLFAPTVKGSYQLLRYNFLFGYQQENLLKFIIFIQFLGIILFFIFWFKNKKNIESKLFFWSVLFLSVIFSCITFFVFCLVFFLSLSFF
jgi:hypothetical protein